MPQANSQTRRERLEEREEAILSAARQAFVEHGFDGATMASIAQAAEVAEGTVYLYFKNKNALLDAVIDRFYQRLTEDAREGVQGIHGTFERLEFLARHHLERCLEELPILHLMISRHRWKPDYRSSHGYELNKTYVAIFDGVCRDGMAAGQLRDDVPLWVIRDQFYGTLDYATRTLVLRGRPGKELDLAAEGVVDILRRGLDPGQSERTEAETSKLENITRRLEKVAAKLQA
ncbi:MAG: TetR/AcrR family transcriptional regulator [Xanthomonadales bacterium]|nr:TetR/AcrR family transcriptional regulator [Xanthomonadales bacterium]